ncbi:single-stranded DNA-binding protein [Melissococcus plutonius]|uniref:Single-stranded DNA-binding protein n=1 Tax=Melissococcus plutonius (strain ATCC 35311 / DSM 29964 / CIP 104052 / LMG 20360 / NCIMB 702443) TaxID=940190 RepID=F3YBI4_MELPT|nr:single-strand DNA-binding protein [Melissococcus plutonius]BAK21862.1 single-stranded DNA-binding protein [Melissococcus plutonius ATCC 35311]
MGVVGRIQSRSYENQQGQRVYVTEVICENFQLLESRNMREDINNLAGDVLNSNESNNTQAENKPFKIQNNSQNQQQSFKHNNFSNGSTINLDSDDLSF